MGESLLGKPIMNDRNTHSLTSQLMNQMCWEILERSHTPIFTLHALSHFFFEILVYIIYIYIHIFMKFSHLEV